MTTVLIAMEIHVEPKKNSNLKILMKRNTRHKEWQKNKMNLKRKKAQKYSSAFAHDCNRINF